MFAMFRETIQENVDMIKLQREVKEKASKLQAVEAKYLTLNEVQTMYKILFGFSGFDFGYFR